MIRENMECPACNCDRVNRCQHAGDEFYECGSCDRRWTRVELVEYEAAQNAEAQREMELAAEVDSWPSAMKSYNARHYHSRSRR